MANWADLVGNDGNRQNKPHGRGHVFTRFLAEERAEFGDSEPLANGRGR